MAFTVEYYGIVLIRITYTRLMCGRIFGNQMAKFSKILMNKDMFTTEMNTTVRNSPCLVMMCVILMRRKMTRFKGSV